MAGTIIEDFRAIKTNDPSAKNWLEVLMCHTPYHAIVIHRFCHWLHCRLRLPVIPRFIATLSRFWSGIEIHPGAKIGKGFFIDHGMGVVIGETAEVGDHCVLFHGVTLGGTGHHLDKRHPTLGHHVLVGANATLLGPIDVGECSKIGATSVVINRDVPARCTVAGNPGRIVKRNGRHTNEPLPMAHYKHTNGDHVIDYVI